MQRRQLLERIPPAMRDIIEFRLLTKTAEQPEFDHLWNELDRALSDQFLDTAAESGITRLEEIFQVTPKANASLEERRFQLSTLMLEQRPTTLAFLRRQLERLCGKGNYSLVLSPPQYLLTVRLALVSKSNLRSVAELIEKIKPANISADIDLLYNRYSMYAGTTYGELQAYTHETLRSEVINHGK